MTFGERIRQLRKQQHLTQRGLADLVDIDFTYLSKIENGHGVPPAEATIRRLAAALHADADELILLADKLPADFEQDLLARPEQQVAALYRSMVGRRYTDEEWREVLRLLRERGAVVKRPAILSERDIELRAGEVLADYTRLTGRVIELPVPIELIIDQVLDIPIEWEPLLATGGREIASKITQPSHGRPCRIVMNADYVATKFRDHPGLIETALAHEAGHGVFHIEHGQRHQLTLGLDTTADFSTQTDSLTDTLDHALQRRGPVGDAWWREWQAHTFMRFALMPRALLLPAMEECGYRRWPQLYDLRRRCNVTISALRVHLEKLGFIRVDERSSVKWRRKVSRALDTWVFLAWPG